MSDNKKIPGMTPAALGALLAGDIENAMVAMIPGGIEQQEAAGQHWLQTAGLLPCDCGYQPEAQKDFEAAGFVFGEKHDEIFVKGSIPKGWTMKPTEHSMWSEVFDEQGRKRAAIFYKAAFYDRKAYMILEKRFQSFTHEDKEDGNRNCFETIVDGKTGETVFTSSTYRSAPDFDREAYKKTQNEIKNFSKENDLDNRGWDDE